MEVHQARAFLAVAQELHSGRAADRLQMAQPPLSRHIKRLEGELGATLFDRSTRHVALTSAGQALRQPARALVEASTTARHVVADATAGHTGTVRFGFAGASVHDLVGRLARRVRTERPGLVLEVHSSQFSHVALERVRDNSLDLAIGRWDVIPDELDSLPVAEEEVLLAVPADHPLAAAPGPVDLADLRVEEWSPSPAASPQPWPTDSPPWVCAPGSRRADGSGLVDAARARGGGSGLRPHPRLRPGQHRGRRRRLPTHRRVEPSPAGAPAVAPPRQQPAPARHAQACPGRARSRRGRPHPAPTVDPRHTRPEY